MSDNDWNARAARAKGWTKGAGRVHLHDGTVTWLQNLYLERGWPRISISEWRPDVYLEQAQLLSEECQRRGMSVYLTWQANGEYVAGIGGQCINAKSTTAAEALTRACVLALELADE